MLNSPIPPAEKSGGILYFTNEGVLLQFLDF